jgi:putative ABC transport system permease protein
VVTGIGTVALFLGVAGLSALIVRPLARVLGAPSAALGVSGELARANATRNPRRTAATASALMIGLALVSFVSIFAASLQGSFRETVERTFRSDAIVQAATIAGVPDAAIEALEAIPEVALVAPAAAGEVELDGRTLTVAVLPPEQLGAVFDLDVVAGDLAGLDAGGLVLDASFADELGIDAGDEVRTGLPNGTVDVPVAALVDGEGLDVRGFLDPVTWEANGGTRSTVFNAYVLFAEDVDTEVALAATEAALADLPQVQVLDQAGFADAIGAQLDQLLGVIYALLALSVLVALLGIVNTLALSVVERTREIGLLRAVGMTRPQVRRMVRMEAISVALIGAALGLALGVPLGAVFTRVERFNLTTLVVPWTELGVGVLLAAIAGLLAGVLPARRAADLDVLDALYAE